MGDESDNERLWREWITPKQALDLYESHGQKWETGAQQIADRLVVGSIGSIAQLYVDARQGRREYHRVPHALWRGFAPLGDSHFWDTGDRKFWRSVLVNDPNAWVGRSRDHLLDASLFGVRFDPEPIRALLPPPPDRESERSSDEEETPADRSKLPLLPDPFLNQWAALFNKVNPGASEAMARAAVNAMFPAHRVTVRALRRVLPPRPPGRPLNKKE